MGALPIQRIPPSPRTVRWGAVVWYRWPLATLAFFGLVVGGLATLMVGMAAKRYAADLRLDREEVRIVTGEVVDTTPVKVEVRGRPAVLATVAFTPPEGDEERTQCYVPAETCATGSAQDVEYLRAEPSVGRVVGSRLTLHGDLQRPLLIYLVLPGAVAALAWILGVLRIRNLLRHGDVALVDEYEIRSDVWSVPHVHEVRYWFRDFRARRVRGRTWVRARSPLGLELTDERPPARLAVVHDRDEPALWNRLVHPEDFCAAPRATRAEPARS